MLVLYTLLYGVLCLYTDIYEGFWSSINTHNTLIGYETLPRPRSGLPHPEIDRQGPCIVNGNYAICARNGHSCIPCITTLYYPRAASRLRLATQEWGHSLLIGPAQRSLALAPRWISKPGQSPPARALAQRAIRPICDNTTTCNTIHTPYIPSLLFLPFFGFIPSFFSPPSLSLSFSLPLPAIRSLLRLVISAVFSGRLPPFFSGRLLTYCSIQSLVNQQHEDCYCRDHPRPGCLFGPGCSLHLHHLRPWRCDPHQCQG